MKIAICDDREEERLCLQKHCKHLGYDNIFIYKSGEELLNAPELPSLHLIFLDIELDGMDGIDIKNILEQKNPSTFIAFCTTHQELMPDAFGRNVINFISKPYSERSVEKTINKTAYFLRDFQPIKIDAEHTVSCRDVLYLNIEHKYTIFHLKKGTTISARKSLKEWAAELHDLGFCPISRSVIINLKYYTKMENRKVLLDRELYLNISRSYIAKLREQYDLFTLQRIRMEQ